jgi:hypothetical protein
MFVKIFPLIGLECPAGIRDFSSPRQNNWSSIRPDKNIRNQISHLRNTSGRNQLLKA